MTTNTQVQYYINGLNHHSLQKYTKINHVKYYHMLYMYGIVIKYF